jgi:hypothetical protein
MIFDLKMIDGTNILSFILKRDKGKEFNET